MSEGAEGQKSSRIEQEEKPNPDQARPNPTEISKGFLSRWRNEVAPAGIAGLSTVLAGMNVASGHYETALISGLAAGAWGAVAVLRRKSEIQ